MDKQSEAVGTKAWAVHSAIIENEKQRRQLLLANMELIHEIHSGKLYQAILGDESAPWSAYLAHEDIFYSASQVYTYDKVYQKFVKELGIESFRLIDIATTKLSNLLGIVNHDNVEDWLSKAESLTTQDFNDELRVAQGKESYLDCKHVEVDYKVCQKCGNRHKV